MASVSPGVEVPPKPKKAKTKGERRRPTEIIISVKKSGGCVGSVSFSVGINGSSSGKRKKTKAA